MKALSITLLLPFLALTAYAIYDVGYWGIFDYHRHSSAGWQVFADLVIALILLLSWMLRDARTTGRKIWGWALATLFVGSISPLLYFASKKD